MTVRWRRAVSEQERLPVHMFAFETAIERSTGPATEPEPHNPRRGSISWG